MWAIKFMGYAQNIFNEKLAGFIKIYYFCSRIKYNHIWEE